MIHLTPDQSILRVQDDSAWPWPPLTPAGIGVRGFVDLLGLQRGVNGFLLLPIASKHVFHASLQILDGF